MSENAAQSVDIDIETQLPENEPTAEPEANVQVEEVNDPNPLEMHKQKLLDEKKKEAEKRRRAEKERDELRQQLKSHEEDKLKEQNKYKELYESQKEEFEEYKQGVMSEKETLVRREKKLAVMKELGKLKKDKYADFIDYDNVIIEEDGSLNQDSVKLVANKFRTDYSELLVGSKGSALNNAAPAPGNNIQTKKKSVRELTAAEKKQIRRDAAKAAAGN